MSQQRGPHSTSVPLRGICHSSACAPADRRMAAPHTAEKEERHSGASENTAAAAMRPHRRMARSTYSSYGRAYRKASGGMVGWKAVSNTATCTGGGQEVRRFVGRLTACGWWRAVSNTAACGWG